MDRIEKLTKMDAYCSGRICSSCKVEMENPEHQCGDGSCYIVNFKTVSDEELNKNYNIVFGNDDEKEEVKMDKFKVGDMVRIIKNVNSHCFKVGDIVEIYGDVSNDNARCRRIGENQTFGNNVWFFEMELVKEKKEDSNTKTLTITTSDSTTTITDGTHTTSINRYYTDKHNERNAVSIVIDKYYDELAEIERVSKLPKVGDKVKVVDSGRTFSHYDTWLIENKVDVKYAIKWTKGATLKDEKYYTIVAIHEHLTNGDILALIEDENGCYIINVEGLKVIK